MPPDSPTPPAYEFGPFRLEPATRHLLREGTPLALKPKAFETLLALVRHRDRIASKDELMTLLWPDTVVEEVNLAVNVSHLRKVLGDSPDGHRYIVTVPGRGYQFVAPTTELREEPEPRHAGGSIEETMALGPGDGGHDAVTSAVPAIGRQASSIPPLGVELSAATAGERSAGRALRTKARLGIAALLMVPVAAAVVALSVYSTRQPTTRSSVVVTSLAVLPFQSLLADSRDEYLNVGLADALITQLSRVRQVAVRPTESVLKYAGSGQDVHVARRELGVDALLAGTVQRADERLRLSVRLIGARDGTVLWAESFDERWTEIFAVQDAIATQVARALALHVTRAERERLARRDTDNAAAYREYLVGRHFFSQRTTGGLKRALDHFERAIGLDPRYALAHAGVADAYLSLASGRVPPQEAYVRAKAATLKALELDPTLAAAHTYLAVVALYHDWDWVAAEREFKRAIHLAPDNADTRWRYGLALTWVERFDEALRETRRSRELDPLNRRAHMYVGTTLYYARRYDESIAELRGALLLDPNFYRTRAYLGRVLAKTGAYGEAITEFTKSIQLGGESDIEADLAHAYAVSGQHREATTILAELIERSRSTYVSPFDIAIVYAGLGDRDQAFAWLEKAHAERTRFLLSINVDPRLDPLRADPRFAALVRRIGVFDTQ